IVFSKEKASQALSAKAIEAGKEDGEYLYYGKDDTMDIPLYEMLRKRLEFSRRLEEQLVKQMEEIKHHGRISLPEYFGECPPPVEGETTYKVRNGIYFLNTKDQNEDRPVEFAVEKTIAENFLSPMAYEYGEERNGYLYYSGTSSAIPLYELRGIFRECQDCIASEVDLISTLCEQYPAYRDSFNKMVPEAEQIPESNGTQGAFLVWQKEKDEIREEEPMNQSNDDYGENVDYGYEP
ncbi:hypothetical protein, partial [Hungatella sp.]